MFWKKCLSAAALSVLATTSMLAYEDENLIDERIFEPPSFGQIHSLWGQHQPHQEKLDYFQIKNKTVFLKFAGKGNGSMRTEFFCDYELADKLKVSFEYKYNGTKPVTIFVCHSPKDKYYTQKVPSAADFTKVELEFPFYQKASVGAFGHWGMEKGTEFALRNLTIKSVSIKPSGGKPVVLDGQKCEVIYYSAPNAIDEYNNRFAGKVLRSSLYDAGAELLPLKKYNGEPLKNAILIKAPEKAGEIPEGGFRLQIKNGGAVVTGARPCGAESGVLALWEKLGIRYFITEEAVALKQEFKAAATDETVAIGIPFRQTERHWRGERIV